MAERQRGDFRSLVRPAQPYLITGLIFVLVGIGGVALGEGLQIHYLSTFLALGGAALAIGGLFFVLIAVVVGTIALARGRRP